MLVISMMMLWFFQHWLFSSGVSLKGIILSQEMFKSKFPLFSVVFQEKIYLELFLTVIWGRIELIYFIQVLNF